MHIPVYTDNFWAHCCADLEAEEALYTFCTTTRGETINIFYLVPPVPGCQPRCWGSAHEGNSLCRSRRGGWG